MSRSEKCECRKYTPVTHVIFDLDGTILETEGIYKKSLRFITEQYGKEMTDEYHVALNGMTETDTCKKVIEDFQLPLALEDFRAMFRKNSDDLIGDAEFMPGAERLIKHFYNHKIPLAIATSSPEYSAQLKFRKKREIFDLFDHIVCGGTDPEVKQGKPAPDIYLIAARRFPDNPPPNKCLVFEDAINGIKAAIAAGMQVIMTPDPAVTQEYWKLATLKLDSLEYMAPQLFGLPPFEKTD